MPSGILYVCKAHTQNEVNILLGGYDSNVLFDPFLLMLTSNIILLPSLNLFSLESIYYLAVILISDFILMNICSL